MTSRRRTLLVAALALTFCPAIVQAQYAEKNGWRFDNFKDATLPWEIYREAFIGIPSTRDVAGSGFDVLFYDQVYETEISKDGNCFGMSLMSLMMLKKGGHLGYCVPISQYSGDVFGNPATGPSDPALKRAINIMHGHQINVPTLQHILDIIGKNKNRDGEYAFQSFQFYKLKNDPNSGQHHEIAEPLRWRPYDGRLRCRGSGRRQSQDLRLRSESNMGGSNAADLVPEPRKFHRDQRP